LISKVKKVEVKEQPKKQTQNTPVKKEVSNNYEASFSFINLTDYKLERALFVKSYALSKWFTEEQSHYLVAQLHQENWAWTENRRWDAWCSVWLIQFNECARWKIPVKDWQWQIKIFVDEIKVKYEISKNFRQAQVAWNNPSVLRTWMYKTKYFYDIENKYNLLFK